MTESTSLRQMEFGEIFSRGFALTTRMLPNAGVIILVLNLVLGLALGFLLRDFFLNLFLGIQSGGGGEEMSRAMASNILSTFAKMIPVFLLIGLSGYFNNAVAINGSWHALKEEEISIGELMRRAVSRDMWVILLQQLIIGAIWIVASMILSLVGAAFGRAGAGIVQLLLFVAQIYFSIALSLSQAEVVISGRGPVQGLKGSFELIKGFWWRTVGLYIVLGIVLSLIMIVVMIPAVTSMIDSFSELIRHNSGGMASNPQAVMEFFGGIINAFPVWLFPVAAIAYSYVIMVLASAQTALHTDLRARKGLLAQAEEEDEFKMGP